MIVDPPTSVRVIAGLPGGPLKVASTWQHRNPDHIGVWLSQPPSERVWPITKTTPDELLSWEVFDTPRPATAECCGDPGDCEDCL